MATSTTIARTDNGTVQITVTIPWAQIEKERAHAAEHMAEGLTVPGFRKGKAPMDRVMKQIPEEQLNEHALNHILPQVTADAIKEHKVTPALYPRFELVASKPNEDWQIRIVTAEIPEVTLSDYRKEIKDVMTANSIWTPEKGKEDEKPKELSKEEKENIAMHTLLENSKITVPQIIIEEESNARLSQLLERLEKLGITLESYLASVGKTADQLRDEYQKTSEQTLKLDFILNAITEKEKVEVSDSELDAFLKVAATQQSEEDPHSDQQKAAIRSMLRKRKLIDELANL